MRSVQKGNMFDSHKTINREPNTQIKVVYEEKQMKVQKGKRCETINSFLQSNAYWLRKT